MENSFVKSKVFVVNGSNKVEAKKEKIKADHKSNDEVEKQLTDAIDKKGIPLSDGQTILLAIGFEPTGKVPQKPITITLMDGDIKVANINKNELISACEELRSQAKKSGIEYLTCLYEHSVPVTMEFKHQLKAIGNINDLVFFFKK